MTQNNKYANGKIYKITDNAYTKCYIGSTIQPLSSRMGGHRRKYKSYLDGKIHLTTSFLLFEEFGIDNCKIELIEECPCENLEQLLKKEGKYIRSIDCVNKCVIGRTIKEWLEDNKEKLKEKSKAYCKVNAAEIRNSIKNKLITTIKK